MFSKLRKLRKTNSSTLGILFSICLITACNSTNSENIPAKSIWVGTWGTAPQLVEPRNLPPSPGLTNNTIRQVVHVSIGGETLRVRFSNEFSSSPVTMHSVHIANSVNAGSIDSSTDKTLSFSGKSTVTIAPGGTVVSDPLSFALSAQTNVALTIYFGDTSEDVTGHPGSRTTSYIKVGNALAATDLSNDVKTNHWYVITGIDVEAPETTASIVVLGDSITGGRGSGTNKQNRWTDELARRLHANPSTNNIAVLNQGIGGNCVLRACLGPSGLDRFDRDILGQSGVRWLILLEGINDIGQIQKSGTDKADKLIAAYEQMIDKAHAKGILVYGATMLPFGDSFYDKPARQTAWKKVNNWIRNSGRFDAVIDLEKAMGNLANPVQLLPEGDTGDHLHPNENGHHLMAEAVDLTLFQQH